MRSAKNEGDVFPYSMNTVCYIEVDHSGNVLHIPHQRQSDRAGINAAYQRAVSKKTVLYAVWPGGWRSDLFVIDDLDAFAQAFGLI